MKDHDMDIDEKVNEAFDAAAEEAEAFLQRLDLTDDERDMVRDMALGLFEYTLDNADRLHVIPSALATATKLAMSWETNVRRVMDTADEGE